MDATIAKAVVDTAHAQRKPVFAHPQNKTCVEVAISAGVDILAHTVPGAGLHLRATGSIQNQRYRVSTDTFASDKNYPDQAAKDYLVQSGVNHLEAFAANGGIILFDTDVGFTKLYDTSLELEFMGLSFRSACFFENQLCRLLQCR
jgi:imidazolonepropionase-like amidohydrolase